MSDVLLGQSYFLRFDPKLWSAMRPYPPLGSLYAASVLREAGHDVALFDAMLAGSEEEWAAALDGEGPRFAVLFEDNFNYLSKMCLLRAREAGLAMIGMAKERGCTTVVCSADATDHPGVYLDAGADFVLAGEGECTLVELIDRLSGRTSSPLESIAGLVYASEAGGGPAGSLVRTAPRPVLKDLDALPLPARDLVNVDRYRDRWLDRHGYFSMNMVTTRGCPFHCNWCAKPIWGQRYNVRSPENVVAEMNRLKEAYAPDHLWFMDDIMGLKPGWLERFADRVEAEDARTPFKCLSRADLLLRGDAIPALRRAGCRTVWIGAESGSQEILDAMEKGTRVEQIREATERLQAAGIEVGWFLQFGYPGEGRADIERTLRMVRERPPDDIGISVSYPLPGTKFYDRVRDQLGARRNWVDSDDMAMLYAGPFSTAFYRQLHTVVHKEFRARRTWRELVGELEPPDLPPLGRARRIAAMVFHGTTLPLARRRLDRLAKEPHAGPAPLAAELDPVAASVPTPQDGPVPS